MILAIWLHYNSIIWHWSICGVGFGGYMYVGISNHLYSLIPNTSILSRSGSRRIAKHNSGAVSILTNQWVNESTNMSKQSQLTLSVCVMCLTKKSCLTLPGKSCDLITCVISLTVSCWKIKQVTMRFILQYLFLRKPGNNIVLDLCMVIFIWVSAMAWIGLSNLYSKCLFCGW